MTTTVHIPILAPPIVEALIAPFLRLPPNAPPHWIVDCTLGGGGHTHALLQALQQNDATRCHKVLALDRDAEAIARAEHRFADAIAAGQLRLKHGSFSDLAEEALPEPVLGLMADLGFSSDQIDDGARGFSFQSDGPLDMRMDPSRGVSCRDFLLRTSEDALVKILQEYGEERFSRRIAAAIFQSRRQGALPKTTGELSQLIVRSVPAAARHGRLHAATRTFQALRIAVNEEMEELDCLLNRVIMKVQPGGVVAILSFHSLEDRKVKQAFRTTGWQTLSKKPMVADEVEVRSNPRARSAKLRMAERLP